MQCNNAQYFQSNVNTLYFTKVFVYKPVFLISTEEKGQKYGAQSPLESLHFGKFTF